MSADGPVIIMAGGTGGHIFPGIAVARELASRRVPVAWLGSSHGLENQLVPKAGIALERVDVAGVRGKSLATKLSAPFRIARAVWQARAVLRRLRPRAVVSFGGFAAGPGGIAAWLLRVPLLVHEQNRVPGMTNRVLARLARRVMCGFPDAFPPTRVLDVVGNPVRREIAMIADPDTRLRDRRGPVRVLVLGGSQGARALNRAVPAVFGPMLVSGRVELRHQTGKQWHDEAWAAYAPYAVRAPTEAFIDDMASAYAWADLVVCRAGALTLAELCAVGVASVLVPYPAAVDDHQTRNAEFLASRGAAALLPETDVLAERLQHAVNPLLHSRDRLLEMARAARALAAPESASRIAELCLKEAAR